MTSRHPHRRAPEGTPPPSGPDRRPAGPSGQAEPAETVAPVNPGAWDTRSWTLVDDADGPPAESGPEPLDSWRSAPGAGATSGSGAQVVWPEAGHPASAALDAEGVPLAEPPTGPLHALDGPPPRRRAAATPTRAPSPAPPAPETRLHTGSFGPTQPAEPDAPRSAADAPRATRDDPSPPHPGGPAPGVRVTGRRAPAPDADAAAPAGSRTSRADGGRRGVSADPVRELMHRHRALCERAVDPLEIAAGLEAHGITDRTAARYRHRDVFSLAEELYVRVPRAEDGAVADPSADGSGPQKPRRVRAAGRGLSHLLPGVLCAATVVGLTYVPLEPPYARPAVGTLGGLAVLAAVRLSLRGVARTRTAALWACWLLGYVLYGDWLLTELIAGGAGVGRLLPALACLCVPLALAFGVAPAAWSAHLFAARARRRLAGSRSLGDFAAGVRPLLLLTVGLFAVALSAVQAAAHLLVRGAAAPHATHAATAALGVLLFVALLLSRHGFPRAASGGLAAACLLIAAALGTVLAARLPGAAAVGRPVEQAVAAYGPTVVPAAACALAALALLAYGLRALTGASAHQRPAAGEASGRLPRQGPAPGPAPTGVEPDPPGDRLARQAR